VKKKIRRGLVLLLVKMLILATRIVPRRLGLSLFSALGSLGFRIYRKDRDVALGNLALAFPASDPMIVRAMARGSFSALGRNVYDALRLVHLPKHKVLELCTIDGEENLRIPFERGRGVIALTGHIGCWELMASYCSRRGYPVSVIARDAYSRKINDMLVSMRRRHGVESIPRGTSAVAGYKVLKRGGILGMLIDQHIDVDGVFVPFFGVPAYTPRGAAAFALKSGAAIVPMAIHMQPDGMHRITILPELERPPAGLPQQERIDELTAACSGAIEGLIRLYPQQWVWFHDRWRSNGRPAEGVTERKEISKV
jgi:KDO2-lipid IV(A) lauroyltransferase